MATNINVQFVKSMMTHRATCFSAKNLTNAIVGAVNNSDCDSDSTVNNNNNINNNKNIIEPNNNDIDLPKHVLMRLETVLRKKEVIIEQRKKSQKQN